MTLNLPSSLTSETNALLKALLAGLKTIFSLEGNSLSKLVDPKNLIARGPLPKYTISINEIIGFDSNATTATSSWAFILCRPATEAEREVPIGLAEVQETSSGSYEMTCAGHFTIEEPLRADRFGMMVDRVLATLEDATIASRLGILHVSDARHWLLTVPSNLEGRSLPLDNFRLYWLHLALASWEKEAITQIDFNELRDRMTDLRAQLAST